MDDKETFLQNSWDNNQSQQTQPQSQSEISHLNDEAKIKEILVEQEKLQKLYNDIVIYIQSHNENMSPDEMIKYQTQLKTLSETYQKNQENLKILWYSSVQVNKDVVTKQWARRNISVKTIFLGIALIIWVFVLGLSILSFYLANNPQTLGWFSNLWIQPAVAIQLLQGISLTVMLIILLLWIVILLVNAYRAFTVKNRSKIWYYSWIVFWIIITAVALWAWTTLLQKISAISIDQLLNPNDIVIMKMVSYETIYEDSCADPECERMEKKPIHWNRVWTNILNNWSQIPLIAPVNIQPQMIEGNYTTYIRGRYPSQTIQKVELWCWDWVVKPTWRGKTETRINFPSFDLGFQWTCFYTQKWEYPLTLYVTYWDWVNFKEDAIPLWRTVIIWSAITLKASKNKKVEVWDNQYISGPLPVEIEFDASEVFEDFHQKEYRVKWYWTHKDKMDSTINEDMQTPDKIDSKLFSQTYTEWRVFYPAFSFPWISNIVYTFPLLIRQSDIPECDITLTEEKVNQYKIDAVFYDNKESLVSDYTFSIMDLTTRQVIEEIRKSDERWLSFSYNFPWEWWYIVSLNYITTDNKKWSCSKEETLKWSSTFAVTYDFSEAKSKALSYEKMNTVSIMKNKVIPLSEVPIKLKLGISKVEPKTQNTKINVFFDDLPKVANAANEYLFDINDNYDHTIKIQISDKVRWLEYEEELKTKIVLDDIQPILLIKWESVWYEPFLVTLDASSSKLNDSSDTIAYFSWDFWDWETQEKSSYWVVNHQYHFNYRNNNWIFTPKVTVFTQKWRKQTVSADQSIVVRKQLTSLDIYSNSHPTQEAKVWDSVKFQLDFSWLPEKIYWDFWDWSEQTQCDWRMCSEMTKIWTSAWTYKIKVVVEFEDGQTTEKTLEFRVRE